MVSGAASPPDTAELLAILEEVKDPEVPVLSVVELGIVRDVERIGAGALVTVTPTYSGCPAMREIETEIRRTLAARGVEPVEVRTIYAPAWTTDWISDTARAKLQAYGIAPPTGVAAAVSAGGVVQLERRAARVQCPRCGSGNTTLQSEFGSTACKSLRVCRACGEPFEEFKTI
jgi:ring-1,2-phenylacetyl-CoA epoxidase subunit PaaD